MPELIGAQSSMRQLFICHGSALSLGQASPSERPPAGQIEQAGPVLGAQSAFKQQIVRDGGLLVMAGAAPGDSGSGSGGSGGSGGGDNGTPPVVSKPWPYPNDPNMPITTDRMTYPVLYGHRLIFPDREQDESVYIKHEIISGPEFYQDGYAVVRMSVDVAVTAAYQEIEEQEVVNRVSRFAGRWLLRVDNSLFDYTYTSELGVYQEVQQTKLVDDEEVQLGPGWTHIHLQGDNVGIQVRR